MKKFFTILTVFTLLTCGTFSSCSSTKKQKIISNTTIQRDATQNIAKITMTTEESGTPDLEIMGPLLGYIFSQADEKYIYYLYYDEIHKFDKKTEEDQLIYKGKGTLASMVKYQSYLYFIEAFYESREYRLCSISIDGKDPFVIGPVVSDCLGMTDQYLFIRHIVIGEQNPYTIFEVENGKACEIKVESINYEYLGAKSIYPNEKNTEILKDGKTLFKVAEDEYIRLKTYSDRYIFADIMDENEHRKQLLFYDLTQGIYVLYDNQEDTHVEIQDNWAIIYMYRDPIEVKLVDLNKL